MSTQHDVRSLCRYRKPAEVRCKCAKAFEPTQKNAEQNHSVLRTLQQPNPNTARLQVRTTFPHTSLNYSSFIPVSDTFHKSCRYALAVFPVRRVVASGSVGFDPILPFFFL
jgi:hypothetical protein